jgi:hypothetical protein
VLIPSCLVYTAIVLPALLSDYTVGSLVYDHTSLNASVLLGAPQPNKHYLSPTHCPPGRSCWNSPIRLSPATSPKFRPLKEYSLSFTTLSKRFCSLYFLHLQQCPLNFILYINSVPYFTFYIDFYQLCACERANTINKHSE